MDSRQKENKLALWGRILWLYTKYIIVTKCILGCLVFPFFSWISSILIHMSGRTNISSGDYLVFLFSIYGIPLVISGVVLLILILGIDINTFILISSLVEEDRLNIRTRDVLKAALISVKYFFSPLGVLLVVFVGLILPLLNIGIRMGPLKHFKIPNFITSVIFNTPLYSLAYAAVLFVFFLLSITYIFSVHFILLDNKSVIEGFRSSRELIKKYWKDFIFRYFFKLIKTILIFAVLAIGVLATLFIVDIGLSGFIKNDNIGIIFITLSIMELFAFFALFLIPIAISILTKLFYKYNRAEGREIENRLVQGADKLEDNYFYDKIRLRTKVEIIGLVVVILIINLSSATLMENYFNEIFKTKVNIEIIAHRAGGDLGAENSIQGIEEAIKENVSWAEIDVQRTKDGEYIINHDADFARVSGVAKTPMELSLEEIEELKIKNEFNPDMPAQSVPTFEEILDASHGKIGVFVELKGKSADEKMVDDVVKIIEARGMLDECVILSLDYKIIEYTCEHYPQIKTGFLYFFSMGKLENLKGDYLIMEEREATSKHIDEIHAAGKKAVVWTVNTPESIDKFIISDVDGIITDHVPLLNKAQDKANKRTHFEIILDSFIR